MAYTKITDINNGDTGASIRPKLNQVFTDLNDINTPTVQRTEDTINVLPTATDSGDNALLVSSGVSDNTKWYKRTFATLWNYIKGKIKGNDIEAQKFIKNGGNANQILLANGDVKSIADYVATKSTTSMGLDGGDTVFGYVNGLTEADWNNQQVDGVILRHFYSSSWKIEVFFDYRGGRIAFRNKNNDTWSAWRNIAWLSDIPTSLPASDVSSWAKASTKPAYTLDEVTDGATRKLSNYLTVSQYAKNRSIIYSSSETNTTRLISTKTWTNDGNTSSSDLYLVVCGNNNMEQQICLISVKWRSNANSATYSSYSPNEPVMKVIWLTEKSENITFKLYYDIKTYTDSSYNTLLSSDITTPQWLYRKNIFYLYVEHSKYYRSEDVSVLSSTIGDYGIKQAFPTLTSYLVLGSGNVPYTPPTTSNTSKENHLGTITGTEEYRTHYLPLAGGTITGDLTVNGTIKKNDGTAKQTLLADGSLGYHQRIFYGTCASTGATQNKVVVCPEITSLQTSDIVIVNFSYGNTHATPRLNVNSLGAKGISVNKTTFNNANISSLINVASIYMFIYNGSTFELLNANGIYDTVVSGSGDFVTDVSLSGSMGISVKKDIGIKDIERIPNLHDALTIQLGSTYNDNVIDTFFDSHYWYFSNSEAFLTQAGNYDTFIIEPFAQGGNLDFSILTMLLKQNKLSPALKRFHIYLKYTLKGVKLKGCVCNTTIYHDGSTYPYQIPGECSAKIECYFDEKSQVWFVEASALSFLSGEYMSEREFRASTNIDNMPMK